MLLDGQERTLRAYHAGDRVTDLVAGYFARVGLQKWLMPDYRCPPRLGNAQRFYPVFTNRSG